jgi:hypothetical protein
VENDIHLKLVGAFHIALGAFSLIGALVIFAVFGAIGGIAGAHGETGAAALIGFIALCMGGLITVLSIPDIVGGWALLARLSWARVLMIVVGCLDLLHFPFGTALGIYTLWALLRNQNAKVP